MKNMLLMRKRMRATKSFRGGRRGGYRSRRKGLEGVKNNMTRKKKGAHRSCSGD